MDLRKGSGLKEDERKCIRCRGRKQLYKTMSGWCFDNSGGVLTDCPMCLGKGVIKKTPDKAIFEKEKESAKRKADSKQKKQKLSEHEKEY